MCAENEKFGYLTIYIAPPADVEKQLNKGHNNPSRVDSHQKLLKLRCLTVPLAFAIVRYGGNP